MVNKCIDCGKTIKQKSTRCKKCSLVEQIKIKKENANLNHCVDCGAIIQRRSIRCRDCANKQLEKPKNHCIDCGKEIIKKAKRCVECYRNNRALLRQHYCVDCGTKINRQSTRCAQCAYKDYHKRTLENRIVNKCVDCGMEIYKDSTRCKECYNLQIRSKHLYIPNYCIDCGKEITRKSKPKRCVQCAIIHNGKKSKETGKFNGKNNANWKGGLSFGKYCYKFNEHRKEIIRNEYNRKCVICGKTEKENGRKLSVHHVSYDKEMGCNGKQWRLVPLCITCHSATHHNRNYWEKRITTEIFNMETPQRTLTAYE